jgi:hypothetical protein
VHRCIGRDGSWCRRVVRGRDGFVEARQNAAGTDADVSIAVVADFNIVIAPSKKP